MGEARPSIVVLSVVAPSGFPPSDRWLDMIVKALAGGAAAGAVGAWRIVVGGPHSLGPADARAIDRLRESARSAGGDLEYTESESPSDARPVLGRLLELVTEDFALVVGPDATVLSSTVIRLLRAGANGDAAVSARPIPFDLDGPALEAGCVLIPRRGASDRTDDLTIVTDPEAAVLVDGRRPPSAVAVDRGPGPARSLLERVMPGGALDRARGEVGAALESPGPPLLSVVMRSQASRPEALREALLCLAGQSDGRFELLLVVHDRGGEIVEGVLDDQPDWLISRTRLLSASGGTRSRPLNVGIHEARGTHIAFLDDDDLVLADWVARFLDAAASSPRTLLRSIAGVQWATAQTWPSGAAGHASVSAIETPYPREFDLADHLRVNMTPFMAFAFPSAFFAVFGGADEALDVCEDWDLVLRAASVLGVLDLPFVTAVYRRWHSGSDSYSLHDSASWRAAMSRIREKLDAAPLLLPPGAASELAGLSALRGTPAELAEVYSSSSWRLSAPIRGIGAIAARLRRALSRDDSV